MMKTSIVLIMFVSLFCVLSYIVSTTQWKLDDGWDKAELFVAGPHSEMPTTSETTRYVTKEEVEPIITDKLSPIITPLLSTINKIIDSVNEVPRKVYCNSMDLATSVSAKIAEYTESMRYYNREEESDNVTIGRRNKVFIESIYGSNVYTLFKEYGNKLYKAPFEEHNNIIWAFLIAYSSINKNVAELLKEKQKIINGDDGINIKCPIL